MAGGEALHLALALHRQPALNAECRTQQLPHDIIELLRIASGQAEAIAAAVMATQASAEELREAARFYVEQQLLARESEGDPWRVLGVHPGADAQQVREHRRLLVGLVHPDRSADWAAAYSDRVNRAWKMLKSPESREAIELRQAAAGREGSAYPASTDDDWDAETDARSRVPSVTESDASSIDEDRPLRVPPRHRSAAMGASLMVAAVALVVGWGIFSDGMSGDEVLVPMGEPTPVTRANVPESGQSMVSNDPATPSARDIPELLQPKRDPPQTVPAVADSSQTVTTAQVAETPVPSTAVSEVDGLAPARAQNPVRRLPVALQSRPPAVVDERAAPAAAIAKQPAERAAVSAKPVAETVSRAENDPVQEDNSIQVTANATPSPSPVAEVRSAAFTDADPVADAPMVDKAPKPEEQIAQVASEPSRPIPNRSAATPKPQSIKVEPITPAVNGAAQASSSAATPPAPLAKVVNQSAVVGNVAVEDLLASFSRSYAQGDLNGLIGLFSRRANSANGGSLALAADYARLFDTTSDRSIVVSGLAWREEGGTLRGQGSFEARYRKQGRLFKQVVGGTLQFVMIEEAGRLRLLRLDSSGESSNL
ncbi:MAG: DnaJ domain-containing protein [Pseudomarimonas sp.]